MKTEEEVRRFRDVLKAFLEISCQEHPGCLELDQAARNFLMMTEWFLDGSEKLDRLVEKMADKASAERAADPIARIKFRLKRRQQ